VGKEEERMERKEREGMNGGEKKGERRGQKRTLRFFCFKAIMKETRAS
jgi:hypothetical protein